MKKIKLLALGVVLGVIIVAVAALFVPQYPFADIGCSDIEQILIYPPFYTTPYTVPEEAAPELVAALNEVVIYRYRQYRAWEDLTGVQYPMITLQTTDGESIWISACNPVFIIDGKGYHTEYDSCNTVRVVWSKISKSLTIQRAN